MAWLHSTGTFFKYGLLAQIFIFALFFVLVKNVFAGEPPLLKSPANNSVVSSTKMEWETPYYSLYSKDPYKIDVDNNSDFSSPERNGYRTDNTFYIPVLTDGVWYWRVKAADSSGSWSEWSEVRSFTLSRNISSTTSESTTPTSTPSPTPTPTTSPSSFFASDTPLHINSSQSFTTTVKLILPDKPNTIFYIKGAFKKSDSTNYFGLTNISSYWVKNGETYSKQYKITTNDKGEWIGNLEVKPDSLDAGYQGPGEYIFRIGRYTSSGSGPQWSNDTIMNIYSDPQTETQSSKNEGGSKPKSTDNISSVIASGITEATIAGTDSTSQDEEGSTTEVVTLNSNQSLNPLVVLGGILILSGVIIVSYLYIKSYLKFSS